MKKLGPIIGLLVLALILWNIDIGTMFSILLNADPYFLLISVAFSMSTLLVLNARWVLLLREMGLNIRYFAALPILAKGVTLGSITPGKIGDLYRARYIMKNTTAARALSSVMLDRLHDVVVLLTLGTVCAALLANLYLAVLPMGYIVAAAGLVLAVIAASLNRHIVKKLAMPAFRFLLPKHAAKMDMGFDDFYRSIYKVKLPTYTLTVSLSILMWTMQAFGLYFRAHAIGIGAGVFFFFLMLPVITLINLLPITVSGLGTTQAGFIFLMPLAGVGTEAAVALSFLHILIAITINSLPGAMIYVAEAFYKK